MGRREASDPQEGRGSPLPTAELNQHGAALFPCPGERPLPLGFSACCAGGSVGALFTPPLRKDAIQKTGGGSRVFSCFNAELSAAGTALSEQKDKGDKSENPPHLPPSRIP